MLSVDKKTWYIDIMNKILFSFVLNSYYNAKNSYVRAMYPYHLEKWK